MSIPTPTPLGEFLCAGHRQIENHLSELIRAVEDGSLGNGAEIVEAALRFFRGPALQHTALEEEQLFPSLRGSGSPEAMRLRARLETLEEEHACADRAHEEVDRIASAWLRRGRLLEEEKRRLVTVLAALKELYRAHIAIEENEVFPAAAALRGALTAAASSP
jgi:hemerythrin-like domain-containing protein